MTQVFVTGGSGFIGGHLISRLVAEGHNVQALARSDRSAKRLAALGAIPVHGDLLDSLSLIDACAGCDLAFHLAGETTPRPRWQDCIRVNVNGTRTVLQACREAGVRRLVHVSSEAVLSNGQPLRQVDETAPHHPDSKAPYPATKARAEQAVIEANCDGFETVIVRPRFVWGAGDRVLLPEMVQMIRSGRWVWIDGGQIHTDITHVDNAVEGLVLAAHKGRPGRIYFITDGEPVVLRTFVSELLNTQGLEPPARSIPFPLAWALTAGGEAAWRFLPLPGRPPLDWMALWLMSRECTVNISRARQELGYEPVRSRADGLAEMRHQAVNDGSIV